MDHFNKYCCHNLHFEHCNKNVDCFKLKDIYGSEHNDKINLSHYYKDKPTIH
jgi:hypothetical protein